jgi:DeoR/GlpR family transcriptional regulator of sugar metabolism
MQEGFTQSNVEEVPVKRQVAANAREVIILADSSKFNQDVLVMFLRLEQVHVVITDNGVRQQDRSALEERGIRVIVVEPAGGGES